MKTFIFPFAIWFIIGSCNQGHKKETEIKKQLTSKPIKHKDTANLVSDSKFIEDENNEYKIHLRELDTTINFKDVFFESKDTAWIKRISYHQFLIRTHVIQKPLDLKYFSARKLLPKLKCIKCDSSKTFIKGILKGGESVEIYLKTKKFKPKKHKIVYEFSEDGEINYTKSIDGQIPWGGEYSLPTNEIAELSINIDGKEVNIPREAFQNFYNFNICKNSGFYYRQLEAYSSLNGKFIYIYFQGGNAAGNYVTKLVFSREKYITRMIADHMTQAYSTLFGFYNIEF